MSLSQNQLLNRSPPPRWLAAMRTRDVRLEQPSLHRLGQPGVSGDHRDLRVSVERPGVEVHRPERDDVVGHDDLCVDDRAG